MDPSGDGARGRIVEPPNRNQSMLVVLYSRRGCHLCEEAEDMLATQWPATGVIDVDADAAARARFGMRVPVLELDGVVVMEGRFDEPTLARMLQSRGSPPAGG
jgi:glutaredoxin